MGFLRTVPLLASIALAGSFLTACGTVPGQDQTYTGSVENNYKARHPINLAEAEHTLDVPVASGDAKLNIGLRDAIRGFAATYKSTSSGVVQIVVPIGAANSGAAMTAKREVRSVLLQAGISPKQLIETSYQAPNPEMSSPIRLSYISVSATTNTCGEWPEDLLNNSVKNENWHNFGCASQHNLAAQIANPMDMVAPRGMTSIDAERRSVVIQRWRAGQSTVSQ